MHATGDIRWRESFDETLAGETTAWLVGEAPDMGHTDRDLQPNEADLVDIGLRRGAEASWFIRRRLLLRRLVGRWCNLPPAEIVIAYNDRGRPLVRHPSDGPFCSVTGRGGMAGLAISAKPVGIDLEPLDGGEIASAVLAPIETAELAALPEAARCAAFLELWVVKEAYLKASGSGLLRDPAQIAVSRRTRTLRDGPVNLQLAASAVRSAALGAQHVTAACICLPRPQHSVRLDHTRTAYSSRPTSPKIPR